MDSDVIAKLKKIDEKIKRIHDTDTLKTIYELFVIVFKKLDEISGVRVSD